MSNYLKNVLLSTSVLVALQRVTNSRPGVEQQIEPTTFPGNVVPFPPTCLSQPFLSDAEVHMPGEMSWEAGSQPRGDARLTRAWQGHC